MWLNKTNLFMFMKAWMLTEESNNFENEVLAVHV